MKRGVIGVWIMVSMACTSPLAPAASTVTVTYHVTASGSADVTATGVEAQTVTGMWEATVTVPATVMPQLVATPRTGSCVAFGVQFGIMPWTEEVLCAW